MDNKVIRFLTKKSTMRLVKPVALILFVTVFLAVPVLAANTGGATVNASALNLRSGAGTGSAIITSAPRGDSVVVQEDAGNGWYKVLYKGREGYMSGEYLELCAEMDANLGTGTIKGSSVRMRAEPSFEGATLGYYNTGTAMEVVGLSGVWYKVSYKGVAGYVHSDYMTLSAAVPGNPAQGAGTGGTGAGTGAGASSTEGQRIVDTAKQYLGVPYVWAGTSPAGFDCSGFVHYVYKECGYTINRTAANIYLNGTAVDKNDLVPGDVICFTTSSSSYIGHVGIYIGDGQFIHASSGSGKVIITDLSLQYYITHYYGARRIVD